MHDTAYAIAGKFFELYWKSGFTQVVEVGSANVNGTLRDHQPEGSAYLGIDLGPGPGVDLVVQSGRPYPLTNEIADVTLSSSSLEHDPQFWVTFLELCRITKAGGFIYINAPSNGLVHRYPADYWRFYPDASRALVAVANANGFDLELIESFTARRNRDVWNDLVCVFQRGPAAPRPDDQCLFHHFNGTNVLRGQSDEFLNPSQYTEDQLLLQSAQAEVQRLMSLVQQLQSQLPPEALSPAAQLSDAVAEAGAAPDGPK